MKKILPAFIILLITTKIAFAQLNTGSLTESDINEIQFQVEGFIGEFQQLLSYVADPSIGEYKRRQLMQNSYGSKSESGNKIFVDEEVIIEDDINPNHIDFITARNNDSSIKKYLNDFDLFISKSRNSGMHVTDVKIFEIGEKDYAFATVYFKSTLIGQHKKYTDKRFEQTEKIATIKADKREGIWDFNIVSIVFYNPDEHENILNPDYSKIPLELNSRISLEESTENSLTLNWKNNLNNKFPVSYSLYEDDNLVVQQRDTTITINRLQPDQSYNFYLVATEDSTGRVSNKSEIVTFTTKKKFKPLRTNSFTFGYVRNTFRKGFIYRIVWENKHKDVTPILELVDNNGKVIHELVPESKDGYANWAITNEFQTGKDFQLIIYDSKNLNNRAVSKSFNIK